MKDTEQRTQQLPEEAETAQNQTAAPTDEQERQFWLDAKYSDAPQDSDR